MADQFETNLPMRNQIPENSGIINNLQQEWTPHQLHIQYQLYSGQHRGIYYAKSYGRGGEIVVGKKCGKEKFASKTGLTPKSASFE